MYSFWRCAQCSDKHKDTLEYKKKHRPLKVKLLDDTVKTMIVDDSMTVEQLVEVIGKKINIKNFEEFSLQTSSEKGEIGAYLAYHVIGQDQLTQ
jgi:hypothetical protein